MADGISNDQVLDQGRRLAADDDRGLHRAAIIQQLLRLCESSTALVEVRAEAVSIVATLATRDGGVLEMVFDSIRRYSEQQAIEDAFPFTPNSFDVLKGVRGHRSIIVDFLVNAVKREWGIPRWKAIEVLCRLNDPEADEFVRAVAAGAYPPKQLRVQDDLRVIERIRSGEMQ